MQTPINAAQSRFHLHAMGADQHAVYDSIHRAYVTFRGSYHEASGWLVTLRADEQKAADALAGCPGCGSPTAANCRAQVDCRTWETATPRTDAAIARDYGAAYFVANGSEVVPAAEMRAIERERAELIEAQADVLDALRGLAAKYPGIAGELRAVMLPLRRAYLNATRVQS